MSDRPDPERAALSDLFGTVEGEPRTRRRPAFGRSRATVRGWMNGEPGADETIRNPRRPENHPMLLGLAALAVGGLVLIPGLVQSLGPVAAPPVPAQAAAVETIEEVPVVPSPTAAPYILATTAFRPVAVTMSSLGITAPIVPVGTAPDGQMEIPPDPLEVGWWEGSALANDSAGNTVLAGHIYNGAYGAGVFLHLDQAVAGDEVEITSQDGSIARYVVTTVELVHKSQFPAERVFDAAGPHQIVLATCGSYDPATSHYEDNVFVFASPIG